LDAATFVQHLSQLFAAPLDTRFHSGQREPHPLRSGLLRQTPQFDEPDGFPVLPGQVFDHRLQTSSQLQAMVIGVASFVRWKRPQATGRLQVAGQAGRHLSPSRRSPVVIANGTPSDLIHPGEEALGIFEIGELSMYP
jgi:hypothetical protein